MKKIMSVFCLAIFAVSTAQAHPCRYVLNLYNNLGEQEQQILTEAMTKKGYTRISKQEDPKATKLTIVDLMGLDFGCKVKAKLAIKDGYHYTKFFMVFSDYQDVSKACDLALEKVINRMPRCTSVQPVQEDIYQF